MKPERIAARPLRGIAMATLAALCWGSATVMSKGALDQVPPIALLVIQLTASLAFLWTVLLIRGVSLREIRDALGAAWLGILEPGLAFILGLIGLAHTKAGEATLINSSEAIMIAALSAALFRERLSLSFLGLSAAAMAGLALASGVQDSSSGGLLGDALIASGTFVAAIYVVLSSRAVADRNPVLVVACQQLAAVVLALLLLPLEIAQGDRVVLDQLPASVWVLAIASGVIQYALAFSFYLAAMRSMTTSVVGAFLYLGPVIGLAGAVIFLGEKFTPLQISGAAIVLGALLLLSWTGAAKPSTAPQPT